MDKEEATKIANELLSHYGKPEEERWQGFTASIMSYGTAPIGNMVFTKQAAEGLLKQVNEHPEGAAVMRGSVLYAVKRAWIEGNEETGTVMVEYEREAKEE